MTWCRVHRLFLEGRVEADRSMKGHWDPPLLHMLLIHKAHHPHRHHHHPALQEEHHKGSNYKTREIPLLGNPLIKDRRSPRKDNIFSYFIEI